MAFTISDAVTLASTWFEETITDAQALVWGNEFLQDIVIDKLWEMDEGDYDDCEANTWYGLPTDFHRSISIVDAADTTLEYESTAYVIRNGKIKFNSAGDYVLNFILYPSPITAISGEDGDYPLPDAFKYPLAEFLIFKYYNIELDDDDSQYAAKQYEARTQSSLKKLYDKMELDSDQDSFQVEMRW